MQCSKGWHAQNSQRVDIENVLLHHDFPTRTWQKTLSVQHTNDIESCTMLTISVCAARPRLAHHTPIIALVLTTSGSPKSLYDHGVASNPDQAAN